jgi:simple sugar transport system ATP-binding protein
MSHALSPCDETLPAVTREVRTALRAGAPAATGLPLVEMRGITKRFGTILANDRLDLTLRRGEVHALLGENGAGKTTLMRVLFGMLKPDAGELVIDGERVQLRSPHDALKRGVGMIPQHSDLVAKLTVAENVVVGTRSAWSGRLRRRPIVADVAETARRAGMTVDPEARVQDLSVDAQQQVEILKLLYRDAQTLILDEPTAVLGPAQVDALFATVRALAADGRAVVIITHKLSEVMAVADRVTVIRRGQAVTTAERAGLDERALATAMVGHDVARTRRAPRDGGVGAEDLLAVSGLHAVDERGHHALAGVSFQVGPGEILGVAGVEGNGQQELNEVLCGLRRPSAGTVSLAGRDVTGWTPNALHVAGVSTITEDRGRWDLIGQLSLAQNLALARIASGDLTRFGFIRQRTMRRDAEALLREYDVRPAEPNRVGGALSGGNQQKLVLARELSREPRLLVASQPTRGLDIDATSFVHRRLLELRDTGCAVVLTSLDLDELRSLSDRIVVLYRGRVALSGSADGLSVPDIAQAMAGYAHPAGPADG